MKYYAIDSTVSVDNAKDAQALHAAFNMDEALICFTNFKDAASYAKDGMDPKSKVQYPIYEIEFKGRKGRAATSVELEDGTELAGFNITPNEVEGFALNSATFAHINKKFKAVDLSAVEVEEEEEEELEADADVEAEEEDAEAEEDAEVEADTKDAAPKDDKTENKPEEKKEEKKDDVAAKSNSNYVIAAGAAVATAVVATGFWFSGFYPAAIATLAKAGLALPVAAIGVQIGVCAAVGLAAVAVLGAAYYGINKLLGSSNTTIETPAVDNRTEDQKYHDKLKSKEDKIKARSEKLTSTADKKFLTDLHAILDIEHTAERKFKKDGALISERNQPKAVDKLLVLKYEAKRLKEVVAAEGADRTKLETAILDTAKKDAAKKFVA